MHAFLVSVPDTSYICACDSVVLYMTRTSNKIFDTCSNYIIFPDQLTTHRKGFSNSVKILGEKESSCSMHA